MKSKLLFWILALALMLSSKNAGATSYTWTGATNDDWSNAGNWSVGSYYPGHNSADVAIFPNTGGLDTVRLTANIALTTITVNGATNGVTTINTNGYTLTVTGTTGGITLGSNAANLTFLGSGAVTIKSISFSGNGDYLHCGSTADHTTNVTFNSGAAIALPANAGSGIFNYGQLNLTSSTITFGSAAQLYNYSTGTITATSCTYQLNNGNSAINNYGAFNIVTAGSFTLSVNPTTITNYSGGTFTAPHCTFTLSGTGAGIQNYGTFTASSTSVFTLSGSTSNVTNYAGGVFNDNGSTYTLTGNNSGNQINNQGSFTATSSAIKLNSGYSNITNSGTFEGDGITVTTGQGSVYISNSGTFTVDSGSAITISQSTCYITNSGTFYAGTSNSACTITISGGSNSYIDNTGTSGQTAHFYLGSTSSINLPSSGGDDGGGSGNYVDNDTNYSVFTIQSDQYGSGAIGPIGSSNTGFTGKYNVERYFQGGTTISDGRYVERNYRIISSPVNTGTTVNSNYVFGLNYIVGATAGQTTDASSTTNAFITGCTGGSTSAGNPSIYLYRESITPSNATFTSGNFLGITNITNSTSAGTITASNGSTYSMPVGTGVFFYFRGAATSWATRTVSPYIAPENVTLTSTGNMNQGNYTFKDWYNTGSSYLAYTGSGTGTNYAVRGFNMVGNPYPCSIDWNAAYGGEGSGIVRTNINPTIWVFNPVTGHYDTYTTTSSSGGTATGDASNIIASGQGFFVLASGSNPQLTISENAKSVGSLPTGSGLLMSTKANKSVVPQLLRLKLVVDSFNYDECVIGFNPAGSTKYNCNNDAVYFPGMNAPESLYSFSSDSVALAINFLPLPKTKPLVIRLGVKGTLKCYYTLKRTELNAVPKIYEFWLMDKYKKDSLDIRNNTSYVFNIDVHDTATYGPNRFSIVIRQNPALGVHLLDFTAKKTIDGAQVTWVTENEQNYTNFTVERSTDGGLNYMDLAGVTSAALGTYSYLDKAPPIATDRYRLKVEDLNGTVTYSNAVTLIYGNGNNLITSNISVFPNPATSVINLALDQYSDGSVAAQPASKIAALNGAANQTATVQSFGIKIVNIAGAVVMSAKTSSPTWQDNIGNLLPGTYVIQVVNNNDNKVVGKETFIKL
ncbi:MAG: beta strand repeat-containing protein [Sphingobacteriales bacterium]